MLLHCFQIKWQVISNFHRGGTHLQLFTIANEIVSWPEALFFLLTYALYIVAMAFNANIEEVAKAKLPVPASWDQVRIVGALKKFKLYLRLFTTEQISPRHWNCTPPSMRYMKQEHFYFIFI